MQDITPQPNEVALELEMQELEAMERPASGPEPVSAL